MYSRIKTDDKPPSAAVIAPIKPAAPPPTTSRSNTCSEDKRNSIIAIAFSGRPRAIVEDMSLMPTTSLTVILSTRNN